MATLTLKQYKAKIKRQNRELLKKNLPLQIAAQTTHALITNRIFHEGRKTDGSATGSYDTKQEMWVENDQLRKAGTNRGKTGNPITTSYYKSYKALKSQQGFNANVVNLRMKNELQSDFANAPISQNSDSMPKVKTIKISPQEYQIQVRKKINRDKMEGQTERFGTIFMHTEDEKKKFHEIVQKELIKFLNT